MKIKWSRQELHYGTYLFGLIFLAFSLPLSRYVTDIPKYLLIVNWILEGNFNKKILDIKKRPVVLLFVSPFFLYAISAFLSAGFNTAMGISLRTLPWFFVPLIVVSSPKLSQRFINRLLIAFSLGAVAASVICAVVYLFRGIPVNGDFRSLSIFKPHNRFSLEIVMATFIMLYIALHHKTDKGQFPPRSKFACFTGAIVLLAFLLFFKSLTGIGIFLILAAPFILFELMQIRRKTLRNTLLLLISGVLSSMFFIIVHIWTKNFNTPPPPLSSLELYTPNHNPYVHNIKSGYLENGHFTDIYVCEPEMQREWNKVSTIQYEQNDEKGQPIVTTLKRYLTSRDLRKDSAGIHKLTPNDISNIQKGLANYKFREYPGLYQRIYETFWEIHVYRFSGFMQNHTLIQRMIFNRIALTLIRQHPYTGVGLLHVEDAMKKQAQDLNLNVSPIWKGKPHNQFLFYMLAFGIPAFIWIMFCWLVPVITNKAYRKLLFNVFAGIVMISMFSIDLLESPFDSIMFFVFFYCLFVFAQEQPDIEMDLL
jgi:hypothetical protein